MKIIVWKDGSAGKGVVSLLDKITPKEWKSYRKRLLLANPTTSKDKTMNRLKETLQKIKENGGFA